MNHGRFSKGMREQRSRCVPVVPRDALQIPRRLLFEIEARIDFEKTFGVPSLPEAVRVLVRLYRAKRINGAGTAKKHWCKVAALKRYQDILPGRRYHHLTSSGREGVPYHGDEPSNLLLIKKDRHWVLHECFGDQTLEEIIIFLLQILLRLYEAIDRDLYRNLRHWYERARGKVRSRRYKRCLGRFRDCLFRLTI
jgi:hypothetical protein